MLTIPQAIAFKEALAKIKVSNRDIGAYYNKTPNTISKNEFKEPLKDALKIKILFGELTLKITYKEWGDTKESRSRPLEEGTYFKVNALTNRKECESFEDLNLSEEALTLIRKCGVYWLEESEA